MSKTVTAAVEFLGNLVGHTDMVNSIVTGFNPNHDDEDAILVSCSRDKTLIIWRLEKNAEAEQFGVPLKQLTGHNHFVTDLTLTNDNTFVVSSSWDKTLRLWDLRSGKCVRQFTGSDSGHHTKEVMTCTFSQDNRQIFSGGCDKTLLLWNTLGQCKMSSNSNNKNDHDHKDWVSKIRFSQSAKTHYYASTGWDGRLKLWSGIFKLQASIKAHDSYINALAISRNGMYLATGGKDQVVKVWEYVDLSKGATCVYKTDSVINALAFNTNYQWLAAATDNGVLIWDIASTSTEPFHKIPMVPKEGKKEGEKNKKVPTCVSLCWSANSQTIYIGCSDGKIRVYNVRVSNYN